VFCGFFFLSFLNSIHQVTKEFQTTDWLLNAKRQQTIHVHLEETLHGTGARHSVSTKILKLVVTEDLCIHDIRTGGHKITSLETIPITSCAKTPGGKPCSEGTVCNCLCAEVCNGYVNNQDNKHWSGANLRLMQEERLHGLTFGVCYVRNVANNHNHLLVGHKSSERCTEQTLA
jgi:hypothetical protein